MSGAQSWSVKGIDPKVREAAREAAARQGMSLGEYLSHALQQQTGVEPSAHRPAPQATRVRRLSPSRRRRARPRTACVRRACRRCLMKTRKTIGAGAGSRYAPRVTDPVRLAQRIESIERRTQLAVTGLDRAVSTIDRSVLGLAARIEDAETISAAKAPTASPKRSIISASPATRLGGRSSKPNKKSDAKPARAERLTDTREKLTAQVTRSISTRQGAWKTRSRWPKKSRAAPKRRPPSSPPNSKTATQRWPQDRRGRRSHARSDLAVAAQARAAAEEAARQARKPRPTRSSNCARCTTCSPTALTKASAARAGASSMRSTDAPSRRRSISASPALSSKRAASRKRWSKKWCVSKARSARASPPPSNSSEQQH